MICCFGEKEYWEDRQSIFLLCHPWHTATILSHSMAAGAPAMTSVYRAGTLERKRKRKAKDKNWQLAESAKCEEHMCRQVHTHTHTCAHTNSACLLLALQAIREVERCSFSAGHIASLDKMRVAV